VAGADEVRSVLAVSVIPPALIDSMLADPPALWLRGESPDVIAGDVALCHPPLGAAEVRVSVSPGVVPGALRVCTLAHDRPGLLAATAGVLATNRLSVVQAAAMTWRSHGWALQRALVVDPNSGTNRAVERDILKARLRGAVTAGVQPAVPYSPGGRARVRVETQPTGLRLVRVAAPDRVGLLWAISSWLEQQGCNILVARAAPLGPAVDDAFLVDGDPDGDELARHLSETVPAIT
jgi:[protein-PII] uridylyltransferase